MKNYIISLEDTEKNTAAPKAKVDVVKYLEELGFVNKYLKFETDSSLKSKIQKYFALKITVPSFFKKHRDMDANAASDQIMIGSPLLRYNDTLCGSLILK